MCVLGKFEAVIRTQSVCYEEMKEVLYVWLSERICYMCSRDAFLLLGIYLGGGSRALFDSS